MKSRISTALRDRRYQVVVAVAAIGVVAGSAIAAAGILAPAPVAVPLTTSTPGASASESPRPSASQAASTATPPIAPSAPPTATPLGSPKPPPHAVTAGVVQAVVEDVRVRESAKLNASVVATLSAGQQARTTASTIQADGFTWTDIELEPSGIQGWAAIAGASGTDPWLVSVADGPLLVTTADTATLESVAIGLGGYVELVDPATGSREPLTSGASVTDLAAAPDGERAAVVVNGQWIETIPLDSITNLLWTPSAGARTFGVVRDPRFSPDGLAIAHRAGDSWGMLKSQVEWYGTGAPPKLASVGPAAPPLWSPDGAEIWTSVADSSGQVHDVHALGTDGSDRRVTVSALYDGDPAPAPDGRTVAYFSDNGRGTLSVATIRPDGTGRQIVYTPPDFGSGYFAPLRWEPAGTRVARRFDYAEDPATELPSEVEVIDVVSGDHTRFAGPGVDCGELTWSPTGTRLALVCRSAPGSARHAFVMGIDGTHVVDLGPAMEIDWAPALSR